MTKIYGSDSKYLLKQHKKYSLVEKLFLYATTLLGTFAFLAFFHGLFIQNSNFLRWLFTLLLCTGVLLFKYAYRNRITSDNYLQGQEGEKEVLIELSKLSENYAVFCDVKLRNKNHNIDFVVTGPTGIFAIEVKSHKGNISSKLIPDAYLKQTARGAIEIQNYLNHVAKKSPFINAILVYSSEEAYVSTFRTDNYVTVIHKAGLNKFITTRKEVAKDINILHLENFLVGLTSHNL